MVDLFDLVGQGLTLFALWLDEKLRPIPWPLAVGSLFLPLVAMLRTLIWVMRGRVWPVACKYHHTTQRRRDRACRQIVAGEWSYCRHHNRDYPMHDGHRCDPSVPRWQRKNRAGQLVDRSDIRGVGFVSLMSNRETLLFYKGVAKHPRQVGPAMLRLGAKLKQDWSAIRTVSLRAVFSSREEVAGVSLRMPRVVLATRYALLSASLGIPLVIASVVVGGDVRRWCQYSATALFFYAWNLFRFGAWKSPAEEPEWQRTALVDSLKAIAILITAAFLGGFLEGLNDSMGTTTF